MNDIPKITQVLCVRTEAEPKQLPPGRAVNSLCFELLWSYKAMCSGGPGRHLQLIMKAANDVKEGFSVLKSLFLAALINSSFPWLESNQLTQLSVLSQSVFTQKGHAI